MASTSATGTGSEQPVVTRFASTTTGFLHFGNVFGVSEAEIASFLFKIRRLEITNKAVERLDGISGARIDEISARPGIESGWTIEALEANLKAYAEELSLGLGKLAQPLRAALTGHTTSPGIFDVLALLGRDESLARIDAQAAG